MLICLLLTPSSPALLAARHSTATLGSQHPFFLTFVPFIISLPIPPPPPSPLLSPQLGYLSLGDPAPRPKRCSRTSARSKASPGVLQPPRRCNYFYQVAQVPILVFLPSVWTSTATCNPPIFLNLCCVSRPWSLLAAPAGNYKVGASFPPTLTLLLSHPALDHGALATAVTMAPKSQPHPAGTESPSLPTAATSSKEGSEAPTSSKQSRNASPSSATGLPPKRADSETAPGKLASTSQPMTKSSSSSSGSNPPDAKDAATGPSPYGTRSRNRTGRARPNYAEDKDIDSDLYDAAPERKDDGDAKRSTRQANPSSTTAQDAPESGPSSASSSSSRKPLPSSDDGKHGGSAAAATTPVTTTTTSAANKESQQQQQNHASARATPAPAANTATASQTSKKRKAGNQGSSSALNQQSAPAHSSASSSAAHKKSLGGGGGVGGAIGYAETNMMSFDDCQGRPKNKTLTADDGTILAVNGE